ncbi:hypothetical protein QTP88_007594 [Uroleucon formosanum]
MWYYNGYYLKLSWMIEFDQQLVSAVARPITYLDFYVDSSKIFLYLYLKPIVNNRRSRHHDPKLSGIIVFIILILTELEMVTNVDLDSNIIVVKYLHFNVILFFKTLVNLFYRFAHKHLNRKPT